MPFKVLAIIRIIGLTALLIFGISGRRDVDKPGLDDITFQRAKAMLSSENPPVVIDVRTPEEYSGASGHIAGSRLIPVEASADSRPVYRQFRDRDILLFAFSGRRSSEVSSELVRPVLRMFTISQAV